MPSVEEIRAELASRKPERSGTPTVILAVLAAFAAGGLLVLVWQLLPTVRPTAVAPSPSAARQAEVEIRATSDRWGRAMNAPLLQRCLPRSVPKQANHVLPPVVMHADAVKAYAQLEMYNSGQLFLTLAQDEESKNHALARVSGTFGLFAECVLSKDVAELCDSNNRSLAVDAVSNHMRHASRLLARPNVSADPGLSHLAALRERVLILFRSQLRDGTLIAADFGAFAPQEVKRIARETRPVRNACATRSK